jgi:hypothetical protein
MPPKVSHGGAITSPWRQYISKTGRVGSMTFDGDGAATIVMFIDVPFNNLVSAPFTPLQQILGYRTAVGAGIKTVPPMICPIGDFSWAYATAITGVECIKPTGIVKGANGDYQGYDTARLSVTFRSLPYAVLGAANDQGVGQAEWLKYTETLSKPAGEFLAANTPFTFVPGGNPGNIPVSYSPITFKGQRGMQFVKSSLTMLWHKVPIAGYYSQGTFRNQNIENGLGRVNNTPFLGFPAGTLLLENPSVKQTPSPLPPGLLGPANAFACYIDVTLTWTFFDPPLGDPNSPGSPLAAGQYPTDDYKNRGHNCGPHAKDGLFYGMRIGTTTGNPQYQAYDMTKVFNMNV